NLLPGARIVVIDDVMTSGATAESCARALLGHGAAQVDILTLARVVRPVDTFV
ncbi:MAG TPA: ComF family protein, partial [Alphaproteobacteria bacterium]|nr:ComF family protein [Alphaproteobacteria bacterium]